MSFPRSSIGMLTISYLQSKSLSSQTSVGGTSQTSGSGKEGEDAEGEWDVSQLVSMLETQVSKLDKQLE